MESVSCFDLNLFHCSVIGDIEGVIAALVQGGRVSLRISKEGIVSSLYLIPHSMSHTLMSCHEGTTPLLAAALEGHTEICGLLLAAM